MVIGNIALEARELYTYSFIHSFLLKSSVFLQMSPVHEIIWKIMINDSCNLWLCPLIYLTGQISSIVQCYLKLVHVLTIGKMDKETTTIKMLNL